MSCKSRYDAVVSIDLGWSPDNVTRTAAAFWRPGAAPWWTEPRPGEPADVLALVEPFSGERTLVLLDIPIHGTDGLNRNRPFRPLDTALQHCGVALYPTYRAGSHGRNLAFGIERISSNLEAVESYPGLVYRFMWAVRDEPWCLEGGLRPVVDTARWKKEWPPNPKKGTVAERRKKLVEQVGVIGRFLPGDYSSLLPGPGSGTKHLDALTDVCDALIALRVGMEMSRCSPWVLEARVGGRPGMIPMLADTNLRALWERSLQNDTFGAWHQKCHI